MVFKFFIIVACVGIISLVTGYSAGAPKESCNSMLPVQYFDDQKDPAPYKLTTSRRAIRFGDKVVLTITGDTVNNTIKGFMAQAHNENKPVGEFVISEDDKMAQAMTCEPGNNNTATHRKHEGIPDPNIITLKWKATEDIKGDIHFVASIMLNGAVFWDGERSEAVRIN